MQTTSTEKKSFFERHVGLVGFAAFFLLTGATAGLTARQVLTTAPGAVNLAGVSAAEGSSTALARADHTHSLTGTLPVANGGTGASSLSCGGGQHVTSNGTTFSCTNDAGGGATALPQTTISIVDRLPNISSTVVLNAGSDTTGVQFGVTTTLTVTGVKFYSCWTSSKTIRASLWTGASTRQRFVDVAVTGTGVYTGTFSSSYTLQASDVNKAAGGVAQPIVSIYDLSGTQYCTRTSLIADVDLPAFPFAPGRYWLWLANTAANFGRFNSGDTYPGQNAGSERYFFVEPIFQDG